MKPLRRTQAITPFGVGAILDFKDDSLLLASPDIWVFGKNKSKDELDIDEFEIYEERLAEFLNVKNFYTPPDYRTLPKNPSQEDRINALLTLPFIRFPLSHVCPVCKKIHKASGHDATAPECRCSGYTNKTHPARFLAVCKQGHIQDFPWEHWVFRGKPPSDLQNYNFYMKGGASAGLNGITIQCKDKQEKLIKKRTMAGAFLNLDKSCDGFNPVKNIPRADQDKGDNCSELLETRLRTSTDLWQAKIMNSIYIPRNYKSTSKLVKNIFEDAKFDNEVMKTVRLLEISDQLKPEIFKGLIKTYLGNHHSGKDVTPKEIYDAYTSDQDPEETVSSDSEDEAYRRVEYDALISGVTDSQNLLVKRRNANQYDSIISENFSQISLAHKLRETRAFIGFSRLGENLGLEEMWNLMSEKSYEEKTWYPAIEVRGEGLFFQFKDEKLNKWTNSYDKELKNRIKKIQDSIVKKFGTHRDPPSKKYILMHTFAHILINQLIYESGYGSASLRERIYCSDGDKPMSGILIYTSAGDSEGTMGGLVRMGVPGVLENVINKALEEAQWCSSDPICIESEGQGTGSVNKAACHNCALLAETSCENFNCALDRGLLIGVLDNKNLGYFNF